MIFRRIFFIVIFSASLTAPVYASALLEQANEAFSKDNYLEAINLYEQMVVEDGHSASLYFNIANSYAQLGETGKAVINYERALRLAPHDADIIKNLSYFKKETGLFLDEQPTLVKLLSLFTTNQWSFITLFFLIITCLTVIFWKQVSKGSTPRAIACLTSFLLLSTVSGLATTQTYISAPSHIVIKDVKLMVSPFESAESKGRIKAGRSASVGKEYKNYIHIKDETGQQGWIGKDSIEAVIR